MKTSAIGRVVKLFVWIIFAVVFFGPGLIFFNKFKDSNKVVSPSTTTTSTYTFTQTTSPPITMPDGSPVTMPDGSVLTIPTRAFQAIDNASEKIQRFESDITLNDNGDVDVVETITYDFGNASKHGIFRYVPYQSRFDPIAWGEDLRPNLKRDYNRVTPITNTVVLQDGKPAEVDTSNSNDQKVWKIGSAKRTITGVHEYKISYHMAAVARAFDDRDEIAWNVTGNGWDVPIREVSATMHLPANPNYVGCFQGPLGSTQQCATDIVDSVSTTMTLQTSNLFARSGMTVAFAMPKGASNLVPRDPILEPRFTPSWAFTSDATHLGVAAALAALFVGGTGVVMFRLGRDRRFAGSAVDQAFGNGLDGEERVPAFDRDAVPVMFEPPDKLRPGQVGTLIDERVNAVDITATIVDLAVRGYLRITEIPKQGWFTSIDYQLDGLGKDLSELLPYEVTLLEGIFQGQLSVRLSTMKQTFGPHYQKVQKAMYEDAKHNKWFRGDPRTLPAITKTIGLMLALLGGVVGGLLIYFTSWGFAALTLPLAGLVVAITGGSIVARTARGYALLQRIKGFRIFIEESEADRAKFYERANLFTEYLPYAIVFDCTEKWAKAFEGMDAQIQAQTNWFVSPNAFTMGYFMGSFHNFSATSVSSFHTATVSSSSGGFSGGGGSSGGGGGGGGGGSW